MNAHVLLNLLSWGKGIKCEACQAFYRFFAASLVDLIILDNECFILIIISHTPHTQII